MMFGCVFSGDRSRDRPQLDWQPGDQQDVGTLLVRRRNSDCSSAVSRLELPFILSRLNEGHTVYLERMIGRCLESEQFRQFKAMGGWKDLQDSVRTWNLE